MLYAPPRVRCRRIEDADIEGVVNLLARGFQYPDRFWHRAFQRLRQRAMPEGYPRYGYLLESGGRAVGAIPMIFSSTGEDGMVRVRCNVSSWFVEPDFRSQAALLATHAIRDRTVTYIVITPMPHVLSILEAQGYERYSEGRFITAPALVVRQGDEGGGRRRGRVETFRSNRHSGNQLPPEEVELLRTHQALGCISLVCTAGDRTFPIIIARHRKSNVAPFATLAYSRDQADFTRVAGPLGRYLAFRGIPLALLDANGPIAGLPGRFYANHPNYFKGPDRPRLGDLAYSKRVFFGV